MTTPQQALARIWAGNPVDDHSWQLLELINPNFTDEDGNPTSHRIVNNRCEPLMVTLETGVQAEFQPGAYDVVLPEKGAQGRQSAKLMIDGVSRRIVQQLERAADGQRAPIIAVIREYAASDLSAPALIHRLTVEKPSVSPTRVTATAVYVDPINQSFPSILYETKTHPSLI